MINSQNAFDQSGVVKKILNSNYFSLPRPHSLAINSEPQNVSPTPPGPDKCQEKHHLSEQAEQTIMIQRKPSRPRGRETVLDKFEWVRYEDGVCVTTQTSLTGKAELTLTLCDDLTLVLVAKCYYTVS